MSAVNKFMENGKEYAEAEKSRKEYAERKLQVLEILDNAKNYYLQDNDLEKADVFSELYKNLENGDFSIVVVGEFSAGKSTLLNALMGRRILPSFSNETTATVNFLRHAEKAQSGEVGRVYYNDGSQEVIKEATLDTIMKFVSTKGDDVANKVDHLDLYLDSDFLRDGVTLVDSPGLNGIADGHREITEAQILKSNASIFLFNSDHPGSKTDFEFLYELQSKVKTIIFVLNKIDEIKPDEGETPETVVESLKKAYKEKFPENTSVPEIWPVAAYPALVARNQEPLEYHDKVNRTAEEKKQLEKMSRLEAFENRLFYFLTCGEKGRQQLLSPLEKVITLSMEAKKGYEEERAVLERKVDTSEIDNQIAQIKEVIDNIEQQISESRNNVTLQIKDEWKMVKENIEKQMSRLSKQTLAIIDTYEEIDDLTDYMDNFERNFEIKVRRIAMAQEDDLKERIITVVRNLYALYADIIEREINANNPEIKLSLSEHINTEDYIIKVGLEKMDEKEDELMAQLEKMNEEVETTERDYYQKIENEKKRKDLKSELSELRRQKEDIRNQILPGVEERYEQYEKKQGGVRGFFGWILDGSTTKTMNKTYYDTSIRDEVKKDRDRRLSEKESEIQKKESELNNVGDVQLYAAEQAMKRAKEKTAELHNKLEELSKSKTQEINEKYKRGVRRIKRELSRYCDSITEELRSQIEKSLREEEQRYTNIALNVVEGALRKNLADRQERLKQLELQLQTSEKERDERINVLNSKIESINVLLGQASDLRTNLSEIPVDQIAQDFI